MNKSETFNQIISDNIPVVVDFFADWCMPCRMLTPILEGLSSDMGTAIRILKVDIDKNPEIARKYGIYSVPTIFLFQHGEIKWKGSGARPKEELKRIIQSNTEQILTA